MAEEKKVEGEEAKEGEDAAPQRAKGGKRREREKIEGGLNYLGQDREKKN